MKPQFSSILFAFLLFTLFPGFAILIIVVVLLQLTATKKHKCPSCEKEVGTDGKFLYFFVDELYSLNLGFSGLIISKKLLVSIFSVIVIFGIISLRVHYHNQVEWTSITWRQFKEECPVDKINSQCIEKYEDKSAKNWKGFLMKVDDNR